MDQPGFFTAKLLEGKEKAEQIRAEIMQDVAKLTTESAVTPIPGGVGPMTITMLMLNTLKAAEKNGGCGKSCCCN